MTDDERSESLKRIIASTVAIGPSDGPMPNEDAVQDILTHLRTMRDGELADWVGLLTWEHTTTAGHWDRIEAGTRELNRRCKLAEQEN